jgi:hypothetical protein
VIDVTSGRDDEMLRIRHRKCVCTASCRDEVRLSIVTLLRAAPRRFLRPDRGTRFASRA